MLCLPCLGSGEFPAGRTCPKCAGRGTLPDRRTDRPMCPYCIGTGRDPFQKGQLCTVCEGWARMPEEKAPPLPSRAPDGPGATGAEGEPATPSYDVRPGRSGSRARSLEDLMRDMAGDVDVCEPCLAADALDRLQLLRHCDMIRVLAHEVDETVGSRIRPFTHEFPHFLFRRYLGRAIRDRYLLTAGEVLFLSPRSETGDEDPESLIRVPATMASEMIEDVRVGYNRMWRAADRLG